MRKMNNPVVKTIESAFIPSAGDPRPIFVQDGTQAWLYFTGTCAPNGKEERVVAVFSGCLASRFGYPNDEALPEHPLYKVGLALYGIFEVTDSLWMDEIISQNHVCFPKFAMPKRRHIVITFHDETFECLADDFELRTANEVPLQALLSNFNEIE